MTREDVIKILDRRTTIPDDNYSWEDINEAIDMAIEALNQQKEGEWIVWDTSSYDWTYKCDKCGHISLKQSNYCPNCGAKMFEPQERGDKE